VRAATEYFSSKNVLARGACGPVYRGSWNPLLTAPLFPDMTRPGAGPQSTSAVLRAAASASDAAAGAVGAPGGMPVPGPQSVPPGAMPPGFPAGVPGAVPGQPPGAAVGGVMGPGVPGALPGAGVPGPEGTARKVAVRVLNKAGLRALELFCGKDLDLKQYRHRSLVPLYAFCLPGDPEAGGEKGGGAGGTQAACLVRPLLRNYIQE
jgi:hypothetical protein